MQLFIKSAEIWVPDGSYLSRELYSSHYSDASEFETISKDIRFAYGEGLPGETWKAGQPLIWTDLDNGSFKRAEAARNIGLVCGVSIPVFAGDFLLAVVVLFCGKGDEASGAIEVWGNADGSARELKLVEGYYGDLERFEWISRRLAIMRNHGLPGIAWETGQPFMMRDLGSSGTFLRAHNAAEAGITTGLAIPFSIFEGGVRILTFLSAKGTPIARRFEIWSVEGKGLALVSGHAESGVDLLEQYAGVLVAKGEGELGKVWLTGRPRIAFVTGNSSLDGGEERALMLPVINAGRLVSVVVLAF
ncbi:MAG: GAF domain-containing protein [Thiothrix sp.]